MDRTINRAFKNIKNMSVSCTYKYFKNRIFFQTAALYREDTVVVYEVLKLSHSSIHRDCLLQSLKNFNSFLNHPSTSYLLHQSPHYSWLPRQPEVSQVRVYLGLEWIKMVSERWCKKTASKSNSKKKPTGSLIIFNNKYWAGERKENVECFLSWSWIENQYL
jgi:hypothetical protein